MAHTEVAIIVGNFNQDAYVKQAVWSALNQIVPDGYNGKLPTFQVVEATDREGIGASAHRNRTIANVDADWILWLDADDLLPSNYLYHVWDELDTWDDDPYPVVGTFAPMQFYSGCRLDKIDWIDLKLPGDHYFTHLPFGMSCMFSKKVWGDVGGFDESLRSMTDLDFWIRISSKGLAFTLNTCMFKRDIPNSTLKRDEAQGAETLAQFNKKHNLDLKEKVLPYWVPSTDIL